MQREIDKIYTLIDNVQIDYKIDSYMDKNIDWRDR